DIVLAQNGAISQWGRSHDDGAFRFLLWLHDGLALKPTARHECRDHAHNERSQQDDDVASTHLPAFPASLAPPHFRGLNQLPPICRRVNVRRQLTLASAAPARIPALILSGRPGADALIHIKGGIRSSAEPRRAGRPESFASTGGVAHSNVEFERSAQSTLENFPVMDEDRMDERAQIPAEPRLLRGTKMNRLFFHFWSRRRLIRDTEGRVLNDLAAAHRHAMLLIHKAAVQLDGLDWHGWSV